MIDISILEYFLMLINHGALILSVRLTIKTEHVDQLTWDVYCCHSLYFLRALILIFGDPEFTTGGATWPFLRSKWDFMSNGQSVFIVRQTEHDRITTYTCLYLSWISKNKWLCYNVVRLMVIGEYFINALMTVDFLGGSSPCRMPMLLAFQDQEEKVSE